MRHKKIKVSLEEGKSSKSEYLNCVSCVACIGSHRQVGSPDQPTAGRNIGNLRYADDTIHKVKRN